MEANHLYVPESFDCAILNNNKTHWGVHNYFVEIPSRWHACWIHYAQIKAGIHVSTPSLPIIDEEYFETIAVWDSVLHASDKFIMIDLGARWGTWAARALSFLAKVNPMPYNVTLVERDAENCKGAEVVAQENSFKWDVLHGSAEASSFLQWISDKPYVTLVESDCQRAEISIFANRNVFEAVQDKVHRLIIATHNPYIHQSLRQIYSKWTVQHDCNFTSSTTCSRVLRERGPGYKIDRQKLLDYCQWMLL